MKPDNGNNGSASYRRTEEQFINAVDSLANIIKAKYGDGFNDAIIVFRKKISADMEREDILHESIAGRIVPKADFIDKNGSLFWEKAIHLVHETTDELRKSPLIDDEHGRKVVAGMLDDLAIKIDLAESNAHRETPHRPTRMELPQHPRIAKAPTTTGRSA